MGCFLRRHSMGGRKFYLEFWPHQRRNRYRFDSAHTEVGREFRMGKNRIGYRKYLMCIHIQLKSYKTYRFPGSNNCIYFFVTGNAKPITASSEFATEGSTYTPSTPSTVSFTSESSLASNSGNISHKDYTPVLLIDKLYYLPYRI